MSERQVVSVGTSRYVRITRIGLSLLIENFQNSDGEERWLTVAVGHMCDENDAQAWADTHEELGRMNRIVVKALEERHERA